MIISIIVPTYNEERHIVDCLVSLSKQTAKNIEVIVVDDGSTDRTTQVIKNFPIRIFRQKHIGPGEARNLGASKAKGEILVFVDADMTFAPDFVEKITAPIGSGQTIGTDPQDEYLANPENFWAKNWNIGRFASAGIWNGNPSKNIVPDKSNFGGIYRAILKKEFNRVGGFEKGGDYADDESLAKKLGVKSLLVRGARFYHRNPDTLKEVWQRASWIGSGKNFTGTEQKKVVNLIKFSLSVSIVKGVIIGIRYREPSFIPFKILYDLAVFVAIYKLI